MFFHISIALVFTSLAQESAEFQASQNLTPAHAAETSSDEASQETAALPDDNERICKKMPLLGSRLKKRVCATRAEWRAAEEQSQELTHRLQRVANINTPRG